MIHRSDKSEIVVGPNSGLAVVLMIGSQDGLEGYHIFGSRLDPRDITDDGGRHGRIPWEDVRAVSKWLSARLKEHERATRPTVYQRTRNMLRLSR
jgi:hypothetical protein